MMETKATSKNWYIVHTYSGFEKKVSESLRQRASVGSDEKRPLSIPMKA